MREWLVAGGLLQGPEGVLLVQKRRRNGSFDWSTPGGVIDSGETLIEGLTREVIEETGLTAPTWSSLAYCVEVDFVDQEMSPRVESRLAESSSDVLSVDDPDAIMVHGAFVVHGEAVARLASGPRWVSEPLTTWLDPPKPGETFSYIAVGRAADLTVQCL